MATTNSKDKKYLKSLFKVLFFCQAFVHKALRAKISANFDDIDTLEVSKIIFVNFCIHFWNLFLSLSVSQKFLTHKRMKKNKKIVKNRLFHQNFQKSTNVDFFQKFHYSSFILVLKCLWYDFGTHTTIFDDFMKIWKSIFFTKKKQFFSKKAFFFQKYQLCRTFIYT